MSERMLQANRSIYIHIVPFALTVRADRSRSAQTAHYKHASVCLQHTVLAFSCMQVLAHRQFYVAQSIHYLLCCSAFNLCGACHLQWQTALCVTPPLYQKAVVLRTETTQCMCSSFIGHLLGDLCELSAFMYRGVQMHTNINKHMQFSTASFLRLLPQLVAYSCAAPRVPCVQQIGITNVDKQALQQALAADVITFGSPSAVK
jgi:hypothetical protein